MQGNSARAGDQAGAAQTAETLRDGILQDLIAVSIMLKDVERALACGEESAALVRRASATLEEDLTGLRHLIRTLEG